MDLELKKKAALITGSSRGIGLAIAKELLREGARACLCARNRETLDEAARACASLGEVVTAAVDVTTEEGAAKAVDATVSAYGRIDLLVNNVGGSRGVGAFDQVDAKRWREILDVNLSSAFLCSRAAVDRMKKDGGGCIVNVSSIFGREYAQSAPYTAAKAGVVALTKEMAVDLARYGIRVNSVAPGSIFFRGGSWEKRQQAQPEKVAQMIERELPWKRFGKPEEVAAAVAFLCSSRASWISGACLPVDGAQGRAL